jgi:hypothetical protein
VLPDEATVPRRAFGGSRLSVVVRRHSLPRSRDLWRDQRKEERVAIASELNAVVILNDAIYLERQLEIDLHLSRRLEHAIGNRVIPANAAVGRADRDMQIVERRVPPRSTGSIAATQGVGVREHLGRALRGKRDWRDDDHETSGEPAHKVSWIESLG